MDSSLIPLSITALVAGGLTILAPCVLPVLPVVLAGSVGEKGRWYPFAVIASLAVSVFAFTVILKASSLLLGIPPDTWTVISGGIVIALGLSYVFPHAWGMISARL